MKYNHALREHKKHQDKYYINSAHKYLMARVICNTVIEAANRLDMDYDNLRKELYEESWDDVMGYQKH